MTLFHWIAHLLGMNHGHVYTWIEDGYGEKPSKIMVGFRCSGCDCICGVHESRLT